MHENDCSKFRQFEGIKVREPDFPRDKVLRKVQKVAKEITSEADVEWFFDRLAKAGYENGSIIAIKRKWRLVDCIKAHQSLSAEKEIELKAQKIQEKEAEKKAKSKSKGPSL